MPEPTSPAWQAADLTNPHSAPDKPDRVRRMFDAIAPSYDLNNRVHSFWQDQRWRRFAVKTADVKPGDVVLDVACGTGDLALAFAATPAASVLGVDFAPNMLARAEQKRLAAPPGAAKTRFEVADATALPLAAASVDVVSIAFGIRNVGEPGKALTEFARVLRPGGRLIVLEFTEPENPIVRWGNNLYAGRVMPLTATMLSGDKSGAYKYLPASVKTFLTRAQMEAAISDAGFSDVISTPLTLGICACYRGVRRP